MQKNTQKEISKTRLGISSVTLLKATYYFLRRFGGCPKGLVALPPLLSAPGGAFGVGDHPLRYGGVS